VDEERLASLRELESRLGYRFNNPVFLDRALTHKSFIHQANSSSYSAEEKMGNEVLEFLGDAVLTLAVSHLLALTFPEAHEGILSLKRSHLVRQSTLAHFSRELHVEDFLLLGKGELQNGGRKKSSILANTYEALIGAIYLDSNFTEALAIVEDQLRPYLRNEAPALQVIDYKSLLQEHAQRTHKQSPKYQVMHESGPDHDKRFQASVLLTGEVKGIGWGRSKKEAEQEAARRALEGLAPSPDEPAAP
jgi:ribonuclease III